MLHFKGVNPHNLTESPHTYVEFECQVENYLGPYYIEWLYHNISFKNVNHLNLNDGITLHVATQNILNLVQ